MCGRNLLIIVLSVACLWMPRQAMAFCIDNRTSETLHVQSLDASLYQDDVYPDDEICCAEEECMPSPGVRTSLVVMTGYVAVDEDKHPGWEAECRIRLNFDDQLIITGDRAAISCRIEGP